MAKTIVVENKVYDLCECCNSPIKETGRSIPDDYWHSVRQVYQCCYRALRSGGIMAVVVKDYVRDGQRVPLCDQTLVLLEVVGFEPLERIRAWLIESEYLTTLFSKEDERTLYEEHERRRRRAYESRAAKSKAEGKSVGVYRPHTFVGWLRAWRQKKRASFFRRDHEKKGSPAIDWEEVLVVRRNKINNQRR